MKMLVNHAANALTRLKVGWKTKNGISSYFRILFRSQLVGESLQECRRLLTGESVALPTIPPRLLTSSNTSPVNGHLVTNERTTHHLQTIRYLNVDRSPVTYITRPVVYEDLQMYKMVHGGIYLTMTEEAGEMAVKKYCSETQNPELLTAIPSLTRIEQSQFLGSAVLGDVLEVEAEVIYTAPHSLRVLVCLYAAPVIQSKARKSISRSWVWYELLNGDKITEVLPVPPLAVKNAGLEEEGRLEHEAIVADRQQRQNVPNISKMEHSLTSTTILDSSSSVMKSFSRASPVLFWIDELAGLMAHQFTQVMCLTGSCDNFNIYSRLIPGSFVTVSIGVVFTSGRTIDVQCSADVETIQDGRTTMERAAEAFFTFVCRPSSNQPTIRQFIPKTEHEKETHERRMKVYEKRKQNSTKH